ncbi:cyclic nucleotide-gated cation channel alpha-3-like isoform X2 [Limulus polyphemus]|uniref:Cyclic nucleotide-gated cation channel alpha-3-like isoform X2 n=1 Tax=Limulus polyphemus TaxID=6850 RepID=A0ABM1S755_LIMPO|nr:cyclic nucleotide-gated cation channel alpha-3-like isoform X2 [Limulus polyphemus]
MKETREKNDSSQFLATLRRAQRKLVRTPRVVERETEQLVQRKCSLGSLFPQYSQLQRIPERRASFSEFRTRSWEQNHAGEKALEQSLLPRRLPPILETSFKTGSISNDHRPTSVQGPSGVLSEGSPNISPRSSPSKSRMRFASQMSVATREEETQPPYFVFHPDGNAIFYWTGLVCITVMYNFWIVILRLAFPELSHESAARYIFLIDTVCDLIYICDIGIQLRTAYLVDGIPVFDPPKLREHYTCQSQFVRDVIAILPTETICRIIPEVTRIPKHFLYTCGGARLTRLAKLHAPYKFYDLVDSRTSNPNGIRAFRLTLSLITVIHWIGCLYYIVSEHEGLGSTGWVYTSDADKQRLFRKYVVCLYWSAMTLTTIGDSSPPETDLEYVFTGLTFLIGVFVFATVVGNVGDVISNMNATRQDFQAKMDQIKMYLTHRKVPAYLQIKVKKWAEYSWSRTQATDESRLLHMLPESLRAEIAVHVHLDTLKKVKIFEQCEHGFLCELVLKLRSQIYSPGDYICRAGETGREMYIINHGKVEVVVTNPVTDEEVVVAVLCEGNYFGEISLLRLDGVQNRRTADVRSVGYSELLCLSRKDLMTALVEYPEAKAILEVHARERIKTNLQAKRTFSVDTIMETGDDSDTFRTARERDREEKRRDIMEIRGMIEELRDFQNVMPQQKITELTKKCENLHSQIIQRDAELKDTKRRILELECTLSLVKSRQSTRSLLRLSPFRRKSGSKTQSLSLGRVLEPRNRVILHESIDRVELEADRCRPSCDYDDLGSSIVESEPASMENEILKVETYDQPEQKSVQVPGITVDEVTPLEPADKEGLNPLDGGQSNTGLLENPDVKRYWKLTSENSLTLSEVSSLVSSFHTEDGDQSTDSSAADDVGTFSDSEIWKCS